MIEWLSALPDELRRQMVAATVVVILYAIWFIKFYVPSITFGIERIQRWFKVEIRYDASHETFDIAGYRRALLLIVIWLLIVAWLIFVTIAPAAVAYSVLALLLSF